MRRTNAPFRTRAFVFALAALAWLAGCASPSPDESEVVPETPSERWERLYQSGERWSQSNSDAASLYHERAYRVAQGFEPGDLRRVRSELALGESRRRQGRMDDAHRLLRLAARHASELSPPDVALRASVLQSLGLLEVMNGELVAAESAFAESALLRVEQIDPHAPETAENIVQLAESQRRLGRYEQAEDNLLQAAEIYLALGPEYAIRIATIQNNLGLLYQETERYVDAETMHRQAILSARQEAVEHNPNTAIYSRGLADLYVRLGRLEGAEELYRYAHGVLLRSVGPDNIETHITEQRLAEVAARLGRPESPSDETFR